ncbi:putative translin-associated factor [Phaeomoniella chlamydospora]|uniref:Putative translin-associated factor n=1 Tax=Phaeomoniella chlamydospora TaxID=158046 RepID=A0A0G2GM94_PHACM|nr:putative translin-associated factor [Phaeomoniella chlamydospora]
MFEEYRTELDAHHDRRERIIKVSRDVTATSKKIIFALQRVRQLQKPLPSSIESDIASKFDNVNKLLSSIRDDLQGINRYRYYRQISPGLQEWMESVAFRHYLQTQSLITFDEAMALLPEGIYILEDDYLLGVFDMTGELMRFAITIIATAGQVPVAEGSKSTILADMQRLRTMLEGLEIHSGLPLNRDWEMKMKTMRISVEKVENSVYEVIVRGKERPKGWVPDLKASVTDREVEAF